MVKLKIAAAHVKFRFSGKYNGLGCAPGRSSSGFEGVILDLNLIDQELTLIRSKVLMECIISFRN